MQASRSNLAWCRLVRTLAKKGLDADAASAGSYGFCGAGEGQWHAAAGREFAAPQAVRSNRLSFGGHAFGSMLGERVDHTPTIAPF